MWPLFIAAPFKLSGPSATVTDGGVLPFGGRSLPVLRLTIAEHPQDWYVLYPDPETGRLRAIAYALAAEESHESRALIYTDFLPVDGVTLASRWTFYHWSSAGGITGDPVGRATLKNIQFVQPGDDFFAKPDDARELAMPTTTPATTEPTTEPSTAPASIP